MPEEEEGEESERKQLLIDSGDTPFSFPNNTPFFLSVSLYHVFPTRFALIPSPVKNSSSLPPFLLLHSFPLQPVPSLLPLSPPPPPPPPLRDPTTFSTAASRSPVQPPAKGGYRSEQEEEEGGGARVNRFCLFLVVFDFSGQI